MLYTVVMQSLLCTHHRAQDDVGMSTLPHGIVACTCLCLEAPNTRSLHSNNSFHCQISRYPMPSSSPKTCCTILIAFRWNEEGILCYVPDLRVVDYNAIACCNRKDHAIWQVNWQIALGILQLEKNWTKPCRHNWLQNTGSRYLF